MVGGGEHGGRDGADSFFGAAPGAQAQELSLKIAVLFARGRPGALDQGGLQPRRAFPHARGAPLARAFVVSGAESSPGDQMARGLKAAHVDADLGDDHLGARAS